MMVMRRRVELGRRVALAAEGVAVGAQAQVVGVVTIAAGDVVLFACDFRSPAGLLGTLTGAGAGAEAAREAGYAVGFWASAGAVEAAGDFVPQHGRLSGIR